MERLTHSVTIDRVSGSHFEIGKQLGERAKKEQGPDYVDKALAAVEGSFLYTGLGMQFELTPEYIAEVSPVVEGAIKATHEGLLEEIRGFAEGLGEDYQRLLVFTSNFGPLSGCSQFFINGYLGRNYDDHPQSVENEFLLSEPDGSYRSFGSIAGYLERLDGMNEKGLAVSLTFGAGHPPTGHGIGAAMYQRIALDKAGTVDEALDIFEKAPYVTPNNVLIADSEGNSAIIEVSDQTHAVRRNKDGGVLYCANSYLDSKMQQHQKIKNPTTKWRERQMDKIQFDDEKQMLDFLTSDFPEGLFEPYFSDGLGTLWTVIYHPETKKVTVAVGIKDEGRQEGHFDLTNPLSFGRLPLQLNAVVPDIPLGDRMEQYRFG